MRYLSKKPNLWGISFPAGNLCRRAVADCRQRTHRFLLHPDFGGIIGGGKCRRVAHLLHRAHQYRARGVRVNRCLYLGGVGGEGGGIVLAITAGGGAFCGSGFGANWLADFAVARSVFCYGDARAHASGDPSNPSVAHY